MNLKAALSVQKLDLDFVLIHVTALVKTLAVKKTCIWQTTVNIIPSIRQSQYHLAIIDFFWSK